MLAEAKKKLQDEMAKSNNSYVNVVGSFLLNHIESHPEEAEKIMQDGKTVAGSLDSMKKEAESRKVDGCAVLTDQEGFAIVLKYFGCDRKATVSHAVTTTPQDADLTINVRLGG